MQGTANQAQAQHSPHKHDQTCDPPRRLQLLPVPQEDGTGADVYPNRAHIHAICLLPALEPTLQE
jgi:hypothetical protein